MHLRPKQEHLDCTVLKEKLKKIGVVGHLLSQPEGDKMAASSRTVSCTWKDPG